jgi:uncharacterized phage-associated protein
MIKVEINSLGDSMTLNVYRNKLLNAILYFSKNTRHCNKTKLLKLLYHLDFIHFKQTGYPSIGLTYYTYKEGPVPVRFWKEVQHGKVPLDFKGKFEIKITHYPKPSDNEYSFLALVEPDLSVFSPRECKIMAELAQKYKYKSAKQISEETHLPHQPWNTTKSTSGLNKPIDYLLSLDEQAGISWDNAKDNLSEFYAAVKNFNLRATKPAEN